MRSPSPRGRHRLPRSRKRLKLYSKHFAEPYEPQGSQVLRDGVPFEEGGLLPQRSLRLGAIGLLLLGLIIWAVVELGQIPALVIAQESQPVQEEQIARSPWDTASFPVENFQAYTSPFGYRDHPFGGRSFHYGLDLAAPMGSYIRSWWEGKIVEVTDDTACGTSVVIQSEDWLHIYCHMQGYVVVEKDGDRWMVDRDGGVEIRQGDRVKSGQRIGRIGMTGRTTGPHLHWGMKYRGSWIDPAAVLKAMAE